jgi:hypothetical protein
MPTVDDLETLVYRQRLTHGAWVNKAVARGMPPTPEASELVWELMVAYSEALQDFTKARDDVYKSAYELAALLLPTVPMKRIFGVYRDRLIETMANAAEKGGANEFRTLLGFTNVISTAFADAQADALKKESLHNRAQSVSRELKMAKRIQTHLLPKKIPTIPGFDFAGRLIPAEEIGGDYWSVKYKEEDGIVTLKLADITGHGVAAATLVAAVKFISGGYYQGAGSAAEVMEKTNRVLAIETPHDILVTMVYGWLRPATRELTLVNAGHSPVFVCRSGECEEVPITGPVLAASETTQYGELNYALSTNDIVFFGSDGITEAGTVQPFGVERLRKVIVKSSDLSAGEIADNVVKAVTDYVPKPHDDISMVVVKVTGDAPKTA